MDKRKKYRAAEGEQRARQMSRNEFDRELAKLQVELVRLQTWVQAKGARVIVVFEGRDTCPYRKPKTADWRPRIG